MNQTQSKSGQTAPQLGDVPSKSDPTHVCPEPSRPLAGWRQTLNWNAAIIALSIIISVTSLWISHRAFELAYEEQSAALRIILTVPKTELKDLVVTLAPAQEDFLIQSLHVVYPSALEERASNIIWPELADPGVISIRRPELIAWLTEVRKDQIQELGGDIGSIYVPLAITADYVVRGRRLSMTAIYEAQYFYALGPALIKGEPVATIIKLQYIREVSDGEDLQQAIDSKFSQRKPGGASELQEMSR